MAELGVNIDHVATVRQARRTYEPDPVWAAVMAELGGADGITIHLREDRRHILDRDVRLLKETVTVKLNLELACDAEMIDIACDVRPDQVTLVPEKREEVTTEGGLDIIANHDAVTHAVERLKAAGMIVSLFLDPDPKQLVLAREVGADGVELHTGQYSLTKSAQRQKCLEQLVGASETLDGAGLAVHAGHGLTYHNVIPVAQIPNITELNIGHSIVSRSVFTGLDRAVKDMLDLMSGYGS